MNSVIIFFVILGLHSSYSRITLNFQGPAAPVFTPMNNDQTVNFDVIPRYAHYLHNNGVKTVIVGDIAGEFSNLGLQNVKDCLKEWVDICKDLGMHVIVQVGGTPFVEVIELVKYSASLEVDAIMAFPDLVMKPDNTSALVDYMALIADAAPHSTVLYHHESAITGLSDLMPEFVQAATRTICNFGGMRYSDPNIRNANKVLNSLEKDQVIYYGSFDVLEAAIALGIKSYASAYYNIFPRLIQQIIYFQTTGDSKAAMDKNRLLAKAMDIISSQGRYVPVMKKTFEMVSGLPMGPPVLPLRQIPNESAVLIRQGLAECGFLEYDDKY